MSACTVIRRLLHEEYGQTAIAVLLIFVGVFAVGGMALDAGFWYFDHRTAENQAEAAALAGVQELGQNTADGTNVTNAFNQAVAWLQHNNITTGLPGAPSANCDSMAASDIRVVITDTNADSYADTVRVCIRRESLKLLSTLSGVTSVKVSASAKAKADITVSQSFAPYMLMSLDNGNACDSLDFGGNANVSVQGGTVYSGGNCSTGNNTGTLQVRGNGVLNVTGGTPPGRIDYSDTTFGVNSNCQTSTSACAPAPTLASPQTDPFASLTQPKDYPQTALTCSVQPAGINWTPGTYCGAGNTRAHITGTTIFATGTYIFPRGLLIDGNNYNVSSTGGVVLYGTCPTSPCCPTPPAGCSFQPGALDFAGGPNLTYNITGKDYTAPWGTTKVVIWMDRTAGGSSPNCQPAINQGTASAVDFSGNAGAVGLTGAIYAAHSQVRLAGNSAASANVAVVGDKICLAGNGTFTGTWSQVQSGGGSGGPTNTGASLTQ